MLFGENRPCPVAEKARELAGPIAADLGFEVVDVEFQREQGGATLRIFIDRQGGVTVEDCASFSEQVSRLLDVNDVVARRYRLDVSSPGLTRPLKRPADFARSEGRLAKVVLKEPVAGASFHEGRIIEAGPEGFTLETGRERLRIALSNVKRAKLEYEPAGECTINGGKGG